MYQCLKLIFAFFITFRAEISSEKVPFFLKYSNSKNFTHLPSFDNSSANPCTNFYKYACDHWISSANKPPYEPIWNPWIQASYTIKHRLSQLLPHFPKIGKFYSSCVAKEFENEYLKDLKLLIGDLGGWPLVNAKHRANRYDWLKVLTKITKNLRIHPLVKIYPNLDYKNPEKFMVYIEPGDLIFPQNVLVGKGYEMELQAYETWIFESAAHMYGNGTYNAREIVKFEMLLARFLTKNGKNERISIEKLSKKLHCGEWLPIVRYLFGNFTEITNNTTVVVKNYTYLKNIFYLIDRLGSRIAVNYLIWATVKDFSRDTTGHMRRLNFLVNQAVLGVQKDLTREHECLDKAIDYLSPLMLPLYVKSYLSPETFTIVNKMATEIKMQLIHNIMESTWLSRKGKFLTVDKIKNIKIHIGFDTKNLTDYYEDLEIGKFHFQNVLMLKKIKSKMQFEQVFNEENHPKVLWPSNPFDANAYYSILQNSIFIPLGLLQPPFFNPQGTNTQNYATLGFLIGHEISHSLDPAGILADSIGKIEKWLPTDDFVYYKNQMKCFGKDHTIGEDFADDNGIRVSLAALRKHQSHDLRQFFTLFAQLWCEITDEKDIFINDDHAAVSERVQNLQRNPDFQQEFHCTSQTCNFW